MQLDMVTKHYDDLEERYYLLYVENISKCSKGGLHDAKREAKHTQANDNPSNPEQCIVNCYDKYVSHRPENVKEFYLTPLTNPKGNVWYKTTPLGVNSLSSVIKNIFQEAGLQDKFTNHSLKRSARSILSGDGFGRDLIIKKTGHASQSDLDYLDLRRKQEIEMSDSINSVKTKRHFVEEGGEDVSKSSSSVVIEKGDCKITICL